ncbi:unnamed protein product [Trichobilharzia regenti]|nr:unnamed protein product [Trichobilharzia regenti]
MKDKDFYNSKYQMHRKSRILTSLNNPEVTWWPSEKAGDAGDQSVDDDDNNIKKNNNCNNPVESTPTKDTDGDVKKPKGKVNKKLRNKSQKQDSKALFKSRLLAAGITMKEYYRSMQHKEEKQKSEGVEK